jgi:Protein of unknown function (DUF1592)/Protein of unknown function (DUF1588)/Protein of unknown function (DUF1585)/Protein of unknown function (DUF1587)/Protein of unknown function (DUF1595)/Planctomycete cytochrome C
VKPIRLNDWLGQIALFSWVCFAHSLVLAEDLPQSTANQVSGKQTENQVEVDEEQLEQRFADHCYQCHGYGESEGGLSFETLAKGEYGERTHAKWEAIWENIRSETMPPSHADERPDESLRAAWLGWIENDVFKLSAEDDSIDPGQVVLRRLNRTEYRRTISDLTGVNLNVGDILPADNTGYGFDTIGEALTLSPVVLERYIEAANKVVEQMVPMDGPAAPEKNLPGWEWKIDHANGDKVARSLPIEGRWFMVYPVSIARAGDYKFRVGCQLEKGWVNTPQQAKARVYRVDLPKDLSQKAETLVKDVAPLVELQVEFNEEKPLFNQGDLKLDAGEHLFVIEVEETNGNIRSFGDNPHDSRYGFYPHETRLIGPFDPAIYDYKEPSKKVFINGPPRPDETPDELRTRAREVLKAFTLKAFRRPCDDATLDRLSNLVVDIASRKGQRYETGMAQALKLILVSPRFLYRGESPRLDAEADVPYVPIDDYSLATRLSYLMWGSPPDDQLLELASKGELSSKLDEQFDRLLKTDWRSREGINDFLGQWLRLRDVQDFGVDMSAIFRTRDTGPHDAKFNWNVRDGMRRETQEMFWHLLSNNLPAHELLNARYTFVNESLANFYGIDGVQGNEMRKVDYPEGSHRRGILSHGSILLITSNPSRTSPVKRGLFVLDNLLGVPAPPAPPNVPSLESSAKGELEKASLRAVLEQHRSDAACASCHSRMDPLGLALENFNALGMYREKDFPPTEKWWEQKDAQPVAIDASGVLMTGEKFGSVEELAEILANQRRKDFYRCLTQKWLTYALGRGLTYRDVNTINKIVKQTEEQGGGLQTLLRSIVHSKPFTHMRRPESGPTDSLAQTQNPKP